LFFIGFSTYLIVGILINRSFQKFSADIDTLKPHQKNQAISIEGPTDLRGLSENLESLRLQLDEDDQQQKAFLQHISHEIKTPLTSIKEGATLLNEEVIGSMTPDQKEVTQILVKSSKELQNAIENLLNYNSMVSSKGQPNRAPIELSSLTKEALGKHELIIKQKQLTLKLEIEEIVAFIDRQKIITVFDNLISNAIKHAPINGQVHIWLQKKKGDKARFIIKDNGPGIIKSQEKAIFDPFFVGKSAGFSTLKGTGLGLSIAKQYVNEHHGDIKLINCHSGAKFQVSFPINS
jgi:two-component system sensor histidine kinase GlrK